MTEKDIKKYDGSKMRQEIITSPRQFKIGIEVARKIKIKKKVNKILICGMGGSALPGSLLKIYLRDSEENIPSATNRNYNLPYWADKKTLIVCISYSGNTEETLSCFREAIEKKLPLVCITSGGEMADICSQKKIPFALVPEGSQPRMALGFQFSALMKILNNCNLTRGLKDISSLEKKLDPISLEEEGKKLAEKIKGEIPVIYASPKQKELARIWKIKFNENSKIPAFFNYIPELNHNELEGFSGKENENKRFHILIIKDKEENQRILKRMNLTFKILRRKANIDLIEIEEGNLFFKIFSNIILSDWTSYWLAIKNQTDPTPVETIEEFKRQLR